MRRFVALALALALCACDAPVAPRDEGAPSAPVRGLAASIAFGPGAPLVTGEVRPKLAPVRVRDPYEGGAVTYLALPARELLDARFGPAWREADEVVFACADGYRAGVPVRRLLAHRAHVAFERSGAEFAIDKPVGGELRRVPLAPAYLVWEPLSDESGVEGEWEWPYQIVGVELASLAERYARLTPATPTSAEAQRGFETFRDHCVRCHAINGQGGRVGPELNYPASVTEYLREEWLLRFILDPTSVRHGTAMPGLPPHVPAREERARELIAYLEAMAARKLAPGRD